MRIITFGSKLSRLVAGQFVSQYRGEIVSSVHFNRADAFLGRFVENTWQEIPLREARQALKGSFDPKSLPLEENTASMLQNQYPPALGTYRLKTNTPFFEALKSQPDLIIVDNHHELGAKLVHRKETPNTGILAKVDAEKLNPAWAVGDILSPEEGAESIRRLLNFFKREAPNSVVVFINYPHSTFANDPDRVERTRRFESIFLFGPGWLIPCLDVPEANRTDRNDLFKPAQYATYARTIADFLRQMGREYLLIHKASAPVSPLREEQLQLTKIKREVATLSRAKDHAAVIQAAAFPHLAKLDSGTFYNVALAHLHLGQKKQALDLLVSLTERTPLLPQALEKAVIVARECEEGELSQRLLQKHLESFPDRAAFRSPVPR